MKRPPGSPPAHPTAALEGLSGNPFLPDLTPGYVVVEGDIQIPLEQYEQYLRGGRHAQAVFGTATLWGDTVPYDFAGNVNAGEQAAAVNAIDMLSALADVTFVLRTNEGDWIRFQDSNFNNSPVGRQGGMQIINITSWSNEFIIAHEILHSLGFKHQQTAPGRDDFVTINWDNICGASTDPGDPCNASICQGCGDGMGGFNTCFNNFDEATDGDTWGPYDFDSVMHYRDNTFTCNGLDTITVNDPWNDEWQAGIGQRDHISLIDGLTLRGLYPFSGDRWLRDEFSLVFAGTFNFPFTGTFNSAVSNTPAGGTLFIDPGDYSSIGVHGLGGGTKTIRATYGPVTLGL